MQITFNLSDKYLRKLLDYAKENDMTVEEQIEEFVDHSENSFSELRDRLFALESLVGALTHDLNNPDKKRMIVNVQELLDRNIHEMTLEDLKNHFIGTEFVSEADLRWMAHYAKQHSPLVTDYKILDWGLLNRKIRSISGIVDNATLSHTIGLMIETDDYNIEIMGVNLDFDDRIGFTEALHSTVKKKQHAKLIWTIHQAWHPKKEQVVDSD